MTGGVIHWADSATGSRRERSKGTGRGRTAGIEFFVNDVENGGGGIGALTALKARVILDNVERILALELMAAAQGIDFRKQAIGAHARLGQGTGAAYRLVRRVVPFIDVDTVMYPYMEAVYRMVADGSLVAAVNGAMQELANPS